jgi:hypothetical protein
MTASLLTRFPALAARAAEAQARADAQRESPEPQQLFLPGLEEFMRAMPNHIARSSLFAPVARGRKAIYKDAVLVSRRDVVIKFWGEQLDEAQADVWMQAMHEAIQRPLGELVIINRADFLRAIGRQTGNYEYKWLNRTMQALAFAMLVIDVLKDGKPKFSVGKNRALHMIEGFDYDDEAEAYALRIDPRWRVMYGNREFSLIDWGKRLQLRQDMAKALQRLVATSKDTIQRHALESQENGPPGLKSTLQYTGRMRDFVAALNRAMRELERLEIIAGGRIETSTRGKSQAVWVKL